MSTSKSQAERPKQILCFDDDYDSCVMMDTLLRMYGYKVTTVCSEADARVAFEREKFNLLIFDGLGLELCKQIRKYDQKTPILFLTGWAYQDDIDNGMNAGAQAYLIKPVDIDALMETIVQFIE